MNGCLCSSFTWHRFNPANSKKNKNKNSLLFETVVCYRQQMNLTFVLQIFFLWHVKNSALSCRIWGRKLGLNLLFQILCATHRALSQIWSDTYLHCWKHRSLSALLIHRHALEISCVRCYSHERLLYPITILKVTSLVSHWAPACVAWIQHVMGFVREQPW